MMSFLPDNLFRDTRIYPSRMKMPIFFQMLHMLSGYFALALAVVVFILMICSQAIADTKGGSSGVDKFNDFFGASAHKQKSFFRTTDLTILDLDKKEKAKKNEALKKIAKKKESVKEKYNPRDNWPAISAQAPEGYVRIMKGLDSNNYSEAKQGAAEFVGYMMNLMFRVREVTRLLVDAMIDVGLRDADDMYGAEDMIEWNAAAEREEGNSPFSPTHKSVLKRINSDSEGRAEVYYFFSLNCEFCRDMGPDVERLWRAVKRDKRVKMSGLVVGYPQKEWLDEFTDYVGISFPVVGGTEIAKTWRVASLPSLVVVSPNGNTAYRRTGQMDFKSMYEFVRKVQGESADMNARLVQLERMPIGFETEGTVARGSALASFGSSSRGHLGKSSLRKKINSNKKRAVELSTF